MRDSRLLEFARRSRREMTEPETRMWLELRAKRFHGIKFRKQKVIGKYIADFSARDPMLVIEIDGDSHGVQREYEERRTRYLEGQGYRVVRFTNEEVMTNLDGVLQRLGEIVCDMNPPLPTLSPEGERAL
ncbi:Very-short-patch-repair endonuclease [Parasphingorhabdus marina DSM 22363]|uniref:Very-short-patch-repair endonuclease n=2 Tax=Parasphingorhabdus marina TaxID=394732 RepID=A0A1N6G7G8_9SPHN|nr:endonuclease domain-containing protein [Parasphingorhabdus marina]SIO03411.1 Very-short-patch-repair endonuclease [Parasphingorhabdus marina DSM 22363]